MKNQKERLAKIMARSGVCSRRDAEKLILQGVVTVNDQLVHEVTTFVDPQQDVIVVQGQLINTNVIPKLWMYHKPRGLITTHRDPQGRPTVFDYIDVGERVVSVGRLDLNTEGLLLLTNHGPAARELELPGLPRVYKVRFFGELDQRQLALIQKPFTIDGIHYQAFNIKQMADKWLQITIHEGKNREIRKALTYIGLQVSRLIRVQYGPYMLGDLKPEYTRRIDFIIKK